MRNFKNISVLLLASLLFTACFDSNDKKSAAVAGQQRQMPPSKVDVFVAKKSDVPISFDSERRTYTLRTVEEARVDLENPQYVEARPNAGPGLVHDPMEVL